jgi:acyl-CoA thioesterase-1
MTALRLILFICLCWFVAPVEKSFASATARKRIVVLGDSLAAGYGVDPSAAFPGLLQKKIDQAKFPYEVVNAGVSGDTTAGGLRRLNWLLKQKVDLLVLELGGNDGLRGLPVQQTKANLEEIIDRTRKANPKVKILLAGMQMPENMGKEFTTAFGNIYPEVAKSRNVALVPFLLEGVGGRPDLNLPDLIHPTEKGHAIIAETMWKYLEPLLKE